LIFMIANIPEIRIGNSTLSAVPAVHYRAVFAEHVNLACADENTRPDAIAVELGSAAVLAISCWLKELGVRPRNKITMPCMMGLVRTNRRVHPDYKDAAIRLQEATGCHLHELPPAMLRKSLSYSPISLICLSPTDSIIEAIRCALELDVPVYGVDLEEFAQVDRQQVIIQDPIEAQSKLSEYVKRNKKFCEACRDRVVDDRRELAMASRLKALLSRHKRVLFTGGLAHWRNIHSLLSDETLRPASEFKTDKSISFMRVLVHPLLATHQMDIFPSVTSWYEDNRRTVPRSSSVWREVNFDDFFKKHLEATYRSYFIEGKSAEQIDRKLEDYHGVEDFERFLANLCTLRQRLVPDMFTALEASEAMMSSLFCESLAKTLMDYDKGWARPSEWPTLNIIGPVPLTSSEESWLRVGQKAELLVPSCELIDGLDGGSYLRTEPFYISCMPDNEGRTVHIHNPWVWPNEPPIEREKPPSWHSRVWPPCDNRLFAFSFQAAEVATNSFHEPLVNYFEGSLYDGVDIKATLRSAARGENRIYVKDNTLHFNSVKLDEINPEPTVFIFSSPDDNGPATWNCLYAGFEEIGKYVKDLNRFENFISKKGSCFVSSVNFFERHHPEDHLNMFVRELRLLKGSIVFGNPCLTSVQAARWLENSKFSCCPSYSRDDRVGLAEIYHEVNNSLPNGTDIDDGFIYLIKMYRERHNIAIDIRDWPTALIQFAIPYAKQRIVVVTPDHFVVGAVAACDARRYGKQLDVLPLSYFSAGDVRKARQQYIVEVLDEDGHEFPPELERLFGEPKDANFLQLPQKVRDQLKVE
jgi:hypothetical protein